MHHFGISKHMESKSNCCLFLWYFYLHKFLKNVITWFFILSDMYLKGRMHFLIVSFEANFVTSVAQCAKFSLLCFLNAIKQTCCSSENGLMKSIAYHVFVTCMQCLSGEWRTKREIVIGKTDKPRSCQISDLWLNTDLCWLFYFVVPSH